MRVRIVDLPKIGEIDELGLRRRFRIGETYELPVQTAVTLMIAGYAESSTVLEKDIAADAPPRRRSRRDEDGGER